MEDAGGNRGSKRKAGAAEEEEEEEEEPVAVGQRRRPAKAKSTLRALRRKMLELEYTRRVAARRGCLPRG